MLRSFSIAFRLGLVLPAYLHAPDWHMNVPEPPGRLVTVEERIVLTAIARGIEPGLALAVAWRESRFISRRSPPNWDGSYDWGVFQLNDSTVRTLAVRHPLDARENIAAGVGLLADYRLRCGGDRGALYAFAWGHCPARSEP